MDVNVQVSPLEPAHLRSLMVGFGHIRVFLPTWQSEFDHSRFSPARLSEAAE
jgi:hypothetical protein